jgi:hypothetical protein
MKLASKGILAGVRAGAETHVLLNALRAHLGTAGGRELEAAVIAGPDWDEVLARARQHAVTPILYRSLASLPGEVVPEAISEEMRRRAEDITLRNLELTAELLRILDRLEAAGIQALPYKGPALAAAAYGDTALREFVDLDILVAPSDVERACVCLQDDGYRPLHTWTPKQERHELRFGHARSLTRGGILVEMHWAIAEGTYALPRDTAPLFHRATRTSLGGRKVSAFAAEDLLVLLCVHGSMHFWSRLAWVCDVAQVLTSVELDPATVRQRAASSGSERMLLLGIEMANGLLGVKVPAALQLPRTSGAAVRSLASRRSARILAADSAEPLEPEGAAQFGYRLRMRDTLGDRITESWRMLATPSESDRRSLPLPDALWPLYYPYRLWRLLWSYGIRRHRPGEGLDDPAIPH